MLPRLTVLFVFICARSTGLADELTTESPASWSHWRGPSADGRASADAAPPLKWSATENIRWAVDLPGEGTSTPVIGDNRIFVLSAESTDRKSESPVTQDQRSKTQAPDVFYRFIVTCVSRDSGDVLWQNVAAEEVPHEGHHPTHTYAAASPTTDGERLFVSFGSRGIFCYSLAGDLLWKKDLGDMRTRYGWGEAVTPAVHGSSLVVNWDQEVGSFITCLDTTTGQEKWTTARPDEVTSWNTPLITEFDGRQVVIVNGTHRVRAYDLADGKELWSCGGQTVNAIPSPIRVDDFVIAMSGYRGSMAVAIPLSSRGEVTQSDSVRWKHSRGTPYVPSPLLSGARLFFTAANTDLLTVLDARTGRQLNEPRRLSGLGSVYASPIAANGHVYFLGRDGTCVVVKDDESLAVVAVNQLNDATDASPVAVGKDLFIRSWTKLYCIAD